MIKVWLGWEHMVWGKMTTSPRLGDLRCHGYNVKVIEQLQTWLKEANSDCWPILTLYSLVLYFIFLKLNHITKPKDRPCGSLTPVRQ